MRLVWALLLAVLTAGASAEERLAVCHGYGCLAQVEVVFSQGQLGEVRRLLAAAVDPASEREKLAVAIGMLYRWAGQQSDIHNDRGGNYADGSMPGKMDCIDHSTSTTRLLQMLERLGYLRWHRVLNIEVRYFAFLFPAHWSAVIGENADAAAQYVVDSWFVNNGEPAVILPLNDWKKGAGPDV